MTKPQHIIERRVLDITLPSGTEADRMLEHDAPEWADRFNTIDSRLFDDMSPGDETLVIDRLEVDLGTLTPDIDFDDLLGLYRQEITSRLKEVIDHLPADGATAGHKHPIANAASRYSLYQAAAHFLEHGTLPHWHQPAPGDPTDALNALAEALSATARRSPGLIADWLANATMAWPIIRRAHSQFGEAAAESILDALPGHVATGLLEVAQVSAEIDVSHLRALLERRLDNEGTASPPRQIGEEPPAEAPPDDFPLGPDEADATQGPTQKPFDPPSTAAMDTSMPTVASHPAQAKSQDTATYSPIAQMDENDTRPDERSPKARRTKVHELQAQALNDVDGAKTADQSAAQSGAEKGSRVAHTAPHDKGDTPSAEARDQAPELPPDDAMTPAKMASHTATPAPLQPRHTGKGAGREGRPAAGRQHVQGTPPPVTQQEKHQSRTPQTPAGKAEAAAAAPNDPDRSGENLRWRRPQATETTALPVRNAGAVLLGPFLPTFFNRLEMLDDDGWRTPEMAARAVHLVQYVASGETETPQYELPLAMVICGLPLGTILPKGITPTDAEQEQAEGLLRAALGHWPQMAGTSIEGLRATFLMRDGLLSEGETRWCLRVEPGPFDVLLDSLPWPYRTLMLSWMPKMLEVEW